MLVDDHALVRSAVRQALVAPDIEIVAEASTAGETLLIAPQLQPDVLLLDLNLRLRSAHRRVPTRRPAP